MLWLAATAIAASAPNGASDGPARATAQARAMVRIVQGTTLRLTGEVNADAPPPREAIVHSEAGPKRVRLIEFQ